ncbi:GGDEF domain-containing protein [Neptuniibacter sp.]|uniref:GGDEF domain-containing protein n=1 Tax=Neptuniibacter sp. TaxID=1962643 RepID=UPI0026316D84|nr:GGDEF domain-containing protein [Neptuniibacter sp.]MCP4596609.1 GGDEF domain-containing protein [Neptuniibacter sp.]
MNQEASSPYTTFVFLVLVASGLLLAVTWAAYDAYQFTHHELTRNNDLKSTRADIIYYDEVLTMSALMAARTGDRQWIDRYHEYEVQLTKSINTALENAHNPSIKQYVNDTGDANNLLVMIELTAFEFVHMGDQRSAWELLNSAEYKMHKQAYSDGMESVSSLLEIEATIARAATQQRLLFNLMGSMIALVCVVVIWFMMGHLIRDWQLKQNEHKKHLELLATFDPLTNLPNRRLLIDRLEQSIKQSHRKSGYCGMVMFIDLDGFKPINDRFGHAVGDQLLITIAQRMSETVREGDTVARLGGDEFIVSLVDVDLSEVESVMPDRVLEMINQPVELEGEIVKVSASIGISLYPQMGKVDAETLIRQADLAMYQAKQAGKNGYSFAA